MTPAVRGEVDDGHRARLSQPPRVGEQAVREHRAATWGTPPLVQSPGLFNDGILAAPARPIPEPGPNEGATSARRPKSFILKENREFLASAFGVIASEVSTIEKVHQCRTCGKVFSSCCTSDGMLKHLDSLSCLRRRVDRGLPLSPRFSPTHDGGAQAQNAAQFIADAEAPAWTEYRARNVSPAVLCGEDSASPHWWWCRHCQRQVRGTTHSSLLLHLARCVGIGPVVRDLHGVVLRTAHSVSRTTLENADGTSNGEPAEPPRYSRYGVRGGR